MADRMKTSLMTSRDRERSRSLPPIFLSPVIRNKAVVAGPAGPAIA